MYSTSDLAEARTIIDRLVQIHPPEADAFATVTFSQKLNRLEELIDVLRYRYPEPPHQSELEEFLPDSVCSDDASGALHFVATPANREVTMRHSPGALVLPLLDYLYTHPGNGRRVLHVIRDFVRYYHQHLLPGDFVRTLTGVVRVETTLRDAARILRWCGLLQYTHREKQKTWRLSLLGILAAGNPPPSGVSHAGHGWKALWQHLFLSRVAPLESMPVLIARLEAIIKALRLEWEMAEPFLRQTMTALLEYRRIINQSIHELPQRQRIAAVEELLMKLNASREAQGIVTAFDERPM